MAESSARSLTRPLCLAALAVVAVGCAHAPRVAIPVCGEALAPQVLGSIVQAAGQARALGHEPVALFDLDETLIDSRARAFRALAAAANESLRFERLQKARAALVELGGGEGVEERAQGLRHYPLDLRALLEVLGMDSAALTPLLATSFLNAYLSNRFCADDSPMPGAVEVVRSLRERGIRIVYLTGRNRPNMETCTKASLQRLGFPFTESEGATLLMKPDAATPDLAFKSAALEQVSALGQVVAAFENEPANLAAIGRRFPAARLVFIDSARRTSLDQLPPSYSCVRDYRSQ